MKKWNKTLTMMLLIVGGLIFADDGLTGVENTKAISDCLSLRKTLVESTTSIVFSIDSSINYNTLKTNNSI